MVNVRFGWFHTRSRAFTLLLGFIAAAFVISVIAYPEQSFQASLAGMKLWWDWVFPALLPFLMVTELLFGLGIVHGLGVLLEPFMRRVFRLPGTGGWALAAGAIGGYPLGADVTAKLRREEAISREEAEHLAGLSHLCNPMLMVGVVGTGFLHSPEAGVILALIHYLSAFAAGLIRRLARPRDDGLSKAPAQAQRQSLTSRATLAMEKARFQDGRAFGKLLGDAVSQSIQALMMIGGLIMIFSVCIRLVALRIGGGTAADWLLQLLPGALEPHLGAYAISRLPSLTAVLQAAAISACLAWSGFSLHAQAISFLKGTGARYGSFLRFRLLHSLTAAGLALILWEPLGRLLQGTEAAFSPGGGWRIATAGDSGGWTLRELGAMWGASFTLLALLLAAMLLVSLAIRILEKAAGAGRSR